MGLKNEQNKYSIAKAGIWYTVGNLIIKGLPFLTLPIFVRILSKADFGLYNTYISYENILSIIIGLGFSGTVKTAKFDFERDFERYISALYTILIVFTIIATPVIFLICSQFNGDLMVPLIIGFLIVHSFSTAVFTINGVRFVILGKYKANLVYTLINTILNIGVSLFLCLVIFNETRYIGRIIGTAISFTVVMMVIVLFQVRREKFNIDKVYFIYAIKMGIPLIPHLVSVTLLSSCDKIMIQNMVGNDEAGIYSLAVNLVTVLSVLVTSLENAWAPWFYTALNGSKFDDIKKRNDNILLLFTYLSCGFILVGPEMIRLFSTAEYADSIFALVPLSISVFLNFIYLIPVNLEYFKKKTYFISAATIICAIINLLLNYVFIKQFGYIYAAHATCISKGCLMVFHYIVSKRLEQNDLFSIWKVLFMIIVVVGVGVLTVYYPDFIVLRFFVVIILTIIGTFFWKTMRRGKKV